MDEYIKTRYRGRVLRPRLHPGRRGPGADGRRRRRTGPRAARPRRRAAGRVARPRHPAARPGDAGRGAAQGPRVLPRRPAARRRARVLRRVRAAGPRAGRRARRHRRSERSTRARCRTTWLPPTSRRTTCRATAWAPRPWRAWPPAYRSSWPCGTDNFPGIDLTGGPAGPSCLLVPVDAPDAVADALISLLRDPQQRRTHRASSGRQLVREHFAMDVVLDQHLRVLDGDDRRSALATSPRSSRGCGPDLLDHAVGRQDARPARPRRPPSRRGGRGSGRAGRPAAPARTPGPGSR